MISHIRIENVALIAEVEVSFVAGLNVLTGETGAGKSIVVDSIGFLLGGRPARDFVRTGADAAHVEGIFELADGEQMMLSRTMYAATGKSTCKIGGRTVTVGMLKEAAAELVDLHGQHEHQSLLDPARQLALLDRFCGKAIADVLPLLAAQLSRYRAANRELKALQGDGDSRARQIEEWQHALDEIAAADVKPGEEDSLAAERTRLASLEQLQAAATGALAALDGEGGAADTASRALSHAATIAKLDEDSAVLHTNLVDAHAALTDATSEIRAYLDRLDADPHRLGELEERLEALYRLKRKYSTTADGLLKKRDEFEAKLAALTDSDAQISRLKAERKVASHEITALCDKLHAARTAAAAEIGGKISEILADLGMANARFSIEITRSTTFTANGNCTAEFMISTNPGEPVKPLRRIASGGEMSRVMLAVKTVMADADAVPTVIFDEVDTGVSGRTAQQVAEKLATVSRRRQILCITHLPQIAAMADTHFLIQKNAAQDRTITSVQPLNPTDITAELARLIGGVQITTATKNAAQEMKQQANQIKVELK